MHSIMVEYQRFGGDANILDPEREYLRTVGTVGVGDRVNFPISQANFARAMAALDYGRFRGGDESEVLQEAKRVLYWLRPIVREFIPPDIEVPSPGPYQLEIVTRARELAQIPFEILEETEANVVVTRRVRQPWDGAPVVTSTEPRVLFAWAAPKTSGGGRLEVPHERQRGQLEEILRDWGGSLPTSGPPALEILPHASRERLAARLGAAHKFTHVHLLAHGVGPDPVGFGADLADVFESSTCLALDAGDGTLDRCPPSFFRELFGENVPRPGSFAIATCHGGEVDPIEAGGTLAHVLHGLGIPVVVASQFALTKPGSDRLIRPFLEQVIAGGDPRSALRDCRVALRETAHETYYDAIAVVGYVHIERDFERQLPERQLAVALTRLKAASREAEGRVRRLLQADDSPPDEAGMGDELGTAARRFQYVREELEDLAKLKADELSNAQLEELRGLQGSSLKREAEAAWKLANALSGDVAKPWLERSRTALREATRAYARAAALSRDHHWTAVQSLSLDAVIRGDLSSRSIDWAAAFAAASDRTRDGSGPGVDGLGCDPPSESALWGHGSLVELYLIAPLVGTHSAEESLEKAREHLDLLVEGCRVPESSSFPVESTLSQLRRYGDWWSRDPELGLPPDVARRASKLANHLEASTGD